MNQNPNPNQNNNNNQNPNQNPHVGLHHPRSACAACKWQRRKCTQDCPFAPYFPQDSQTQFLNVHKLFGIKKIFNLIQSFEDKAERDAAMATIIMQANLREQYPVLGSCGEIFRLRKEIERTQVELNLVINQLAMLRSQAQAQQARVAIGGVNDDGHGLNVGNNGGYPFSYLLQMELQQAQGEQQGGEVVQVQSQEVLDHQFSEMFQGLNQWGLVERNNNGGDGPSQLLLQGGGGGGGSSSNNSSNAGGMTNLLHQQEEDSAFPFFDFERSRQAIINQPSENVAAAIREETDSIAQIGEETKNFMLHMQKNDDL